MCSFHEHLHKTTYVYIVLRMCSWKLCIPQKGIPKVLEFVLSPRLQLFASLLFARGLHAPRAKRRPFDHFQDKWRSLRMQYPAWRKKPPLCRMQLRVTVERARVPFTCVCVPCHAYVFLALLRRVASENSSNRSPVWIFMRQSESCSNPSGGTRVSFVPWPRHIRIPWFVLSK